jgi:hypothetical protein
MFEEASVLLSFCVTLLAASLEANAAPSSLKLTSPHDQGLWHYHGEWASKRE